MLSSFLNGLFQNGEVIVEPTLFQPAENDVQLSLTILRNQYERSLLEMPQPVPPFEETAGLWAGLSLCRIIQFTLVRELGPEEIATYLPLFDGEQTPAAIYSADLSLRYLPDLLSLAKGLAPDDPLVSKINTIAKQWPYSSVGMKLEETVSPGRITEDFSLLLSYADRIILKKDTSRLQDPVIREQVLSVLGNHGPKLWPDFPG